MQKIVLSLIAILILTQPSGIQIYGESEPIPVIKEYELPDTGRKAWNRIKDDWMRNQYSGCIKKFKLRMSCGSCVYIYMKGHVSIDRSGRLKLRKKTGSNVCGKNISPDLERCFIEPLEEMVYPDELKGTEFETMLGTGLKC